jgi:hypothetical protein
MILALRRPRQEAHFPLILVSRGIHYKHFGGVLPVFISVEI